MIYKGARAIIEGGAQLGTSQKYADASARKAQDVRRTRESAATAKERAAAVEQTIQESGLRGDDGVPPGYPTVTAEAFFHQVDLYWPDPPASDEVVGSLVRIRPEGESSRIVRRPRHSATIKNLPHKPHTFEVLLFDKWGRESLWSDAVTATPMLTAAETIDLGEIAMLGRLRGLLPNLNLATIEDATKLATNLIDSGHLAPDSVKRVQLEDAAVNGVKIADGAVTGPKLPNGAITGPKIADRQITATKVGEGEITTPLLAANSVEADKIAASAVTTTKLDAGAVNADKLAANSVTTPKINAGAVVADSIAANQVTTPKINTNAVTANEIATNAVRAAQINANAIQTYHILAGAVTADTMASQNAAAFNLWAQNAMIRSAAIQSITADKITAGAMTAGRVDIAGSGSIRAGGVTMDSSGFSAGGVKMTSGGFTLPAVNSRASIGVDQALKISTPIAQSGVYFVWDNSAYYSILQSDSNSGNGKQGLAELAGIHNSSNFDASGNATIIASSYNPGNGQSAFTAIRSPQNTVVGPFLVDGKFYPKFTGGQSSIAANGGASVWTHGYGNIPNHVEAWCNMGGGVHRPIDFIQELFIEDVTTSIIRVRNGTNTNRNVYIYAWE